MIRNILSNWLGLIITGALSVFLTPFLVHSLGPLNYGMWMAVAAALDYYGFLDLGIRTTLQRYVARHKSVDDRLGLERTFTTALLLMAAVMVVIWILSFALVFLLPVFFRVEGAEAAMVSRLVLLLGLATGITFPARVVGAYLLGHQRFDLYNIALVTVGVARAAALFLTLFVGGGVLGVGLVTLGASIVLLAVNTAFVRRIDPDLRLRWREVNRSEVGELGRFSIYIFLAGLGDSLRFQSAALIIGRVLGLALVTPFSIAAQLMEYFKVVLFGLLGPFMPAMSALDAQGREDELRSLLLRATKLTAIFSLLVAGLLWLNGRALIALWVGERFVGSYAIALVLVVGYAVALAQSPGVVFLQARGKHQIVGWWTVGEGLANVLLSLALARRFGILGVAFGTAIPMLVVKLAVQPWYVMRAGSLSAQQYLGQSLFRPVAAGLGYFGALHLIIGETVPQHTMALVVRVALQAIGFAILVFFFVANDEERKLALEKLAGSLKTEGKDGPGGLTGARVPARSWLTLGGVWTPAPRETNQGEGRKT